LSGVESIVARQKRKPPTNQPVTQHQLFPAVVALWFGALFGLGSLAVRPSLLEELVIKSRIDLLVPAAAPPLGMTARMVIALAMAALGAIIGTAIAQRLARPKQEARERKRTTLSTRDEGAGTGTFNAYGDASTRNPGPVSDDGAAPRVQTGRRRALAIEPDDYVFVPHDMAPLPGGAPQIFDIAAAGLNDAPPLAAAPEPGSYFEAAPEQTPSPVALDWANAAPVHAPAAVPLPQASSAPPSAFAPAEPIAPAMPADGRQVFGMTPPANPPADQPRQIFGVPVAGDHVPREFVEAHGFSGSVFDFPEPSPLFGPRGEALPTGAVPTEAPPPAAIPESFAVPESAALPAGIAVPDAAFATISAAPEPKLPSPASLGIEDLSARLAESMRRRRKCRDAAPVAALAEVDAPQPAVPEAIVPLAIPQACEPEGQSGDAGPEPISQEVPAFSVPPFAVPPFTVPAAAQPVETVAAPIAEQPLPAALRPLDLAGFEDDDQAGPDSLLPPRRIAFPVAAPPAPEAPAAYVPPLAAEVEPEASDEAAVAEENYASLLGVSASPATLRNPFVRIEEPEIEAEAETIEPVVIFPGQAVPAPQPFAAPAAATGDEVTPFRRFDAPATAGQGQPSATNDAAIAVPSEEAERALRSALANLQRMSGAA
jgi:hypothetical protein